MMNAALPGLLKNTRCKKGFTLNTARCKIKRKKQMNAWVLLKKLQEKRLFLYWKQPFNMLWDYLVF